MAIYLASNSPRRIELLSRKVPKFEHFSRGNKEKEYPNLNPREKAIRRSKDKCLRAISKIKEEDMVIISGDTVVDINGIDLGKPKDEGEAFAMLSALSGREHIVCTGVTVMQGNRSLTDVETTRVRFAPLSEETIWAYIRTGEPMDKAGAYGIQGYGALLIEGIDGDYFNVVGLPVRRLGQMLQKFGVKVLP